MAFEWATEIPRATEMVEGPYYGVGGPRRSDIRGDANGIDFHLALKLVDLKTHAPLQGLVVDLWHCDSQGRYSGYSFNPDLGPEDISYQMPDQEGDSLRGSQVTNADGVVEFLTIFPGWYASRSTHLHLKMFDGDNCILTTQLFFPRDVTDRVYSTEDTYQRKVPQDTHNESDTVLAITDDDIDGCWAHLVREDADGVVAESVLALDPTARSVRFDAPEGFLPPVGGIVHNKPVL